MARDWWWPWWISSLIDIGILALAVIVFVRANRRRVRQIATLVGIGAIIAAGLLRKCIPLSAGGESAGLTDTAIMVEELYAVNASVTLTLIGTVLGLLPLLIGGTEEQRSRLLPQFLKQTGAPLAGFCATEPGGSANAASPRRVTAFVPRLRSGVTDGS